MAASYIEALLPEPFDTGGAGILDWRWNNASPLETPVTVTFRFLTAAPDHAGMDGNGFQPLTAAQQTAFRTIAGIYEEICNIDFVESAASNANLLIGRNTQSPAGYAYFPDLLPAGGVDGGTGGDIWVATSAANLEVAPGESGWNTLMHELGHAVGLKHPFEPDPLDTGTNVLPVETDTTQYTVMSYTDHPFGTWREITITGTGFLSTTFYPIGPSTPMLYDIAALQYLYGANMTTRAGNDVYTFDPAAPFFECIWDAGGTDTISVSNFTLGCEIDLGAGQFSSITILPEPPPFGPNNTAGLYNGTDNLAIAFGVTIENATGGAGNDTLTGNTANNVLNGGLGNDTMEGGLGNDTYVRNAAGDVITELASQGTDTVQSAIAYTLAANLERLTLTGSGNVNGTGNGANNVLTGNAGNNVLNGGTGNDTMAGGLGNDTYVRNTAGDVVTELANQGNDLVQSAVTYTLPVNVERLTLTGAGHINATGNGGNNTLTGNAGNNILNGIAGNDTMAGGLGNDTYVRNVAGDVVTEAAGQGNDLVQTAVTYTLGANLERLTLTGTGNINGTGNVLANVINGNAGNNVLDGVGGADTLNGLGGNDTLVWHATDTLVDGGVGSDTLRINGANQTLNLLTVANTKIVNVEVINLTGTGNNRLELSLQDVLDLSSTTNTLRVDGNAGDTVDRNAGWAQGANQVIGANTYRSYTQGAATLLVDTDITSVA